MSRWKAAFIHLCVSALIALTLLSVIYFVLYPPPLFIGMGGSELLMVMVAVDVVLGPLLTLLVFKSGKKLLWMDLSLIFALQLTALVYGVSTMVMARPVFIVVRSDFASVIAANDLPPDILDRAKFPELKVLSWTGPEMVAVRLPQDPAEKSKIMDLTFSLGRDIQALPEHYLPYSQMALEMRDKARPLSEIVKRKADAADAIGHWLEAHQLTEEQVRTIDLLARKETYLLALSAEDGRYLGIIPVDPN